MISSYVKIRKQIGKKLLFRGVTVEYWTKTSNKTVFEAKTVDPDSVRTMTQDSENFLFEKKAFNTYPESITE